jgi:hypothetical protein
LSDTEAICYPASGRIIHEQKGSFLTLRQLNRRALPGIEILNKKSVGVDQISPHVQPGRRLADPFAYCQRGVRMSQFFRPGVAVKLFAPSAVNGVRLVC